MRAKAYEFTQAIVRRPAPSVVDGLRAVDVGAPDYQGLCAEHEAYIAALSSLGVSVTILDALEEFPDAIFTEDPALTFPQGAILLRPGASSRRGEAAAIAPTLMENFETVLTLPKPGFVEGGDVLRANNKVMIGLSDRTNREGAEALVLCLEQLGLKGEIVQTPRDVLHFKTDCSLLDEETIITTKRLERSGVFKGFKTILVPEGEEAAANALRVNEAVLVGEQFPKTRSLLEELGYHVSPLSTVEIGKIDAGLSCMSLRW